MCSHTLARECARADLCAPDQTSRRVGRISRNETVELLEYANFFAPQRGVSVTDYGGMNPGDVVYAVGWECKWINVWRRGDFIEGVGEEFVDWEPRQRLHNPTAGHWVRLERANGQRGWMRSMALSAHLTPERPSVPEPAEEEGEEDYDCE
jgi:hypothetical protein